MTDSTDKDDYLGYGVYADTLWNRIQAALDKDLSKKDGELGDDPLVVGIFGEWGAGKSTLLKLTLNRAADYGAQRARNRSGKEGGFGDAGFGLTIPVLFQPWKYEHEPHLLVPLLLHIIQALRDSIPKAQTLPEKTAQVTDKVWSASIGSLPALVENFEAVYKATVADLAVADPVTTAGVSVGFKTAGWLAKLLKRPDDADWLRDFKFSSEGRFFYNFHNVLCALTRPGKREEAIGKLKLSLDTRINFVIFIDDLDRCLPEKAVEALELIKTVFNLESFAFVLALDEEVVERGIGHRYKDYALKNKKPEMPITGFEYLEKIVHLPFRLPGLTNDQARLFLRRYEQEQVAPGKPERWWFAPRPVRSGEKEELAEDSGARRDVRSTSVGADLSSLVLRAFNGYVPRKLVRLVELLHQVQEVTLRRGRTFTVDGASGIDIRVVTALAMIQLFQPDLYRIMRRKPQAFPLLLAAFAKRPGGWRDLPDSDVSDVDLWLWVVDESAGEGNEWIRSCEATNMADGVVARIAGKFYAEMSEGRPVRWDEPDNNGKVTSVLAIDKLQTLGQRWRSQHVKLPLVAQIVEHRAAQRHVFDPLRLMHALAGAMESGQSTKDSDNVSPAAQLSIEPYFSLLVPHEDPHWDLYFGSEGPYPLHTAPVNDASVPAASVSQVGGAASKSPTSGDDLGSQPVLFPDRLFADLVSEQTEVQANLLANNELVPSKPIEKGAAQALLDKLRQWKQTRNSSETNALLTRGLRVMAPLVPRDLGGAYLQLVDSSAVPPWQVSGDQGFPEPSVLNQAVKRAELRSALGQDNRFDAKRLHLPRQRLVSNERNTEREPIPGFVRVFENKRETFQPFTGPPVTLTPYYMARYLTTVDQFAEFVISNGYGDPKKEKPDWWDTLGWRWRIGQSDSLGVDWDGREADGGRSTEQRVAPGGWNEQLGCGSRPVIGVSWFEARAYARWLTLQLRGDLERLPSGYEVRLPSEAQWERAARAANRTHADERQYPWGDAGAKNAHLRANIEGSKIGQPCPVGLFAPNPLGLCDLSGNVWEWQNNLYRANGHSQDTGLTSNVDVLKTDEDWKKSDLPALRGGAWYVTAVDARASVRSRDLPDLWYNSVGFRVVLSLAEQNPET